MKHYIYEHIIVEMQSPVESILITAYFRLHKILDDQQAGNKRPSKLPLDRNGAINLGIPDEEYIIALTANIHLLS